MPEFKTCPTCQRRFPRTKTGVKAWMRRHYCSRACQGKEKIILPKEKTCVVCAGVFKRPEGSGTAQWRKRLCCSPACARAAITTHHLTGSKEYRIWTNMKTRCLNPNSDDYHRYGARGITICERWLKDFAAFFADMGTCPAKMSLDRRDNNDGYYPGNCQWSTATAQAINRDRSMWLTYRGKTQTVSQWADECGISRSVLGSRINRGVPVQRALDPTYLEGHYGPQLTDSQVMLIRRQYYANGHRGVRQMAREMGVSHGTIRRAAIGKSYVNVPMPGGGTE